MNKLMQLAAISLSMLSGQALAERDYPADWGGVYLGEGNQCLSVSGTYDYVGEVATAIPLMKPTLDANVFSKIPPRGEGSSIKIVHDPASGKLSATIFGEKLRGPTSFTVKVGCKDGWVTFSEERDTMIDGNQAHVKSVRFFAQAGDGALIVSHIYRVESSYFFSMFKRDRQSESWYRFPAAE